MRFVLAAGPSRDYDAMRRVEVLHVRGETAGKTPLWRLAVTHGCVGGENPRDLPLQLAPVALEVPYHRWPRHR